jgi:hypothetical protein
MNARPTVFFNTYKEETTRCKSVYWSTGYQYSLQAQSGGKFAGLFNLRYDGSYAYATGCTRLVQTKLALGQPWRKKKRPDLFFFSLPSSIVKVSAACDMDLTLTQDTGLVSVHVTVSMSCHPSERTVISGSSYLQGRWINLRVSNPSKPIKCMFLFSHHLTSSLLN